ncbi:hypothetical protein NLI96_g8797 [Meripilus lineatus]|uniref:Uncharacterized protein n=1 Tax=Meripilus lineatus TaxID=2056292 RepID=A0AAD5UYB3_9APHY|nr:hypothetical protein NLI96_g8797 [Physisporinus lineatus]
MPRRHLQFSLRFADENNKPANGGQIVFIVVPRLGIGKSAAESSPAHPVIYKSVVQICTFRKEAGTGIVKPYRSLVISGGQFAEVVIGGNDYVWTETMKWSEDENFEWIVVRNASAVPQAFALCLPFFDDERREQNFLPILSFNQIPDGEKLPINIQVELHAWHGPKSLEHKLQVGKEFDVGEEPNFSRVHGEDNKPWVVDIESNTVRSWVIVHGQNGRIRIEKAESRETRVAQELQKSIQSMSNEIKELRSRVDAYDEQVRALVEANAEERSSIQPESSPRALWRYFRFWDRGS